MGLISVTGLLNQVEHLNTKKDMKKFIVRWTGANLDRSKAMDFRVDESDDYSSMFGWFFDAKN